MGGYAFGTQPGPLQVTPQGGATDSIDREAIARGEAYEEPKPPVALQPGGLNLLGKQGYQAINEQMAKMREDTTRRLTTNEKGEKIMGPLGEIAANLINPVPGSIPQAGMLVSGPAIGTIARSPLARGVATGAVDAALGGIEGGGMGALLGGTGGLAAGVTAGGVSKMGQPTKGFQALTKTKEMGLKYGSPEVQGWLRGMQEKELTRGGALADMQRSVSKGIEDIIGHVSQTFPANQQITVLGVTPRTVAQYNASKSQAVHHLGLTEDRVTGQVGAMGSFRQMDEFRNWLRQRNDPAWRQVMDEMVYNADIHANSLGNTQAGQAYRAALKQYAIDKRLMDIVEGIQEIRSKGIIGGVNPTDYPEAEKITELALGGKGNALKGASEVAIGASHPGWWGQYHMLKGVGNILKGEGKPPISGPLRKPGLLKKGLAETGAGIISATPGVPRLPKKTQETEE